MKNKKPDWRLFLLAFTMITLSMLLVSAVGASGSAAPEYMLMYEGFEGWKWFCLDERPYQDSAQQSDAEIEALVTRLGSQAFVAYIVEVDSCNLDMIFRGEEGGLYAWRFTSHQTDEHLDHRHMTRGAAWIDWLSLDDVYMGR